MLVYEYVCKRVDVSEEMAEKTLSTLKMCVFYVGLCKPIDVCFFFSRINTNEHHKNTRTSKVERRGKPPTKFSVLEKNFVDPIKLVRINNYSNRLS